MEKTVVEVEEMTVGVVVVVVVIMTRGLLVVEEVTMLGEVVEGGIAVVGKELHGEGTRPTTVTTIPSNPRILEGPVMHGEIPTRVGTPTPQAITTRINHKFLPVPSTMTPGEGPQLPLLRLVAVTTLPGPNASCLGRQQGRQQEQFSSECQQLPRNGHVGFKRQGQCVAAEPLVYSSVFEQERQGRIDSLVGK